MNMDENVQGLIKDFTCGYCLAQSGYNIAFAQDSEWYGTWGEFYSGTAIAVLECRNCKMFNVLMFDVDEEGYGGSMDEFELGPFMAEHPEIIYSGFDKEEGSIAPTWIELMGQYPHGHKLSKEVPGVVRKDLKEAANCLAVGSANAAAIMCRRVIERLAAHFGVKPDKGRMLGETLKELEGKKLVDERLLKAFKEIKDWGNIGTHPNENDDGIDLLEAKKIVEFAFLVVDHIFPQKDIHSLGDELRQMRDNKTKAQEEYIPED
jgi:hypothetical protein